MVEVYCRDVGEETMLAVVLAAMLGLEMEAMFPSDELEANPSCKACCL